MKGKIRWVIAVERNYFESKFSILHGRPGANSGFDRLIDSMSVNYDYDSERLNWKLKCTMWGSMCRSERGRGNCLLQMRTMSHPILELDLKHQSIANFDANLFRCRLVSIPTFFYANRSMPSDKTPNESDKVCALSSNTDYVGSLWNFKISKNFSTCSKSFRTISKHIQVR